MKTLTTTNLGEFILSCTSKYRDRPAFILKDSTGVRRPVSFYEFNQLVQKITQWFQNEFPQPGFKVGLWGENRMEWCALALASWSAGGTIVPLMPIAKDLEVRNIIEAARIDILFASPKLATKAEFPRTHLMDLSQTRGVTEMRSLGDLLTDLRSKLTEPERPQHTEDQLAVLIFTSGTTGHPKGVMLSHKNILTNILDILDKIPVGKLDRAVSVLPLAHLFELVGGFAIAHLRGLCISYPDSLKPDDVLGEMKVHKATLLVAVPLFFEIIDRAIQERLRGLTPFQKKIFSRFENLVLRFPYLGRFLFKDVYEALGGHIRYFVTGGAKISPDVVLRFRKLGITFLQGYGLTETSPIISFTPVQYSQFESVGMPLPSVRVKIVDEEICVSGPSVFLGYYDNPEATGEVMKDGWFHTGDLGRLDDEHFLYVTGRKKDMIVTSNGKNVYPEEIEDLLKTSPLISEVAVFGVDSERGEEVHAVIVPTSAVNREPRRLKSIIKTEVDQICSVLSDYKKVKDITLSLQELPKTATKKVKKHVLKQALKEGTLGSPTLTEPDPSKVNVSLDLADDRQAWLQKKVVEISKREEVSLNSDLRGDLGLDSLTLVELVSAVEHRWGISMSDGDVAQIRTVGDILEKIAAAVPEIPKSASPRASEYDLRYNDSLWIRTLRFAFHVLIIRPFLKVFFRFKVVNPTLKGKTRNWIMTPNHSSHLDILMILSSVPLRDLNKTYAVAAEDYFFNKPLKSFFVRLFFNAVPFDRRARVDKGFRICESVLKNGGNLVIFPEGTRSLNGQLAPFKPGVGRLLASRPYPAIPAYIRGAHRAFPKGSFVPRPSPLSVFVGEPIDFDRMDSNSENFHSIAGKLQDAVVDLRHRSQVHDLK